MSDLPKKGMWGWITATFPPPKPDTLLWRVEKWVTALHVWIFRKTGGRLLGDFDGAPLCVLHHRGAKTGVWRSTPMIHMPDGDRAIVVASMGGNPKNPAWYHNLRAHPDIKLEARGGTRQLRARRATDAEATELWPRLLQMWPAWEVYMTRTNRIFPVMICEPPSQDGVYGVYSTSGSRTGEGS